MSEKNKNQLVDGLLMGGAMLIAAGAGVLHLAAGLITAGVLAIAGGLFLGRGIDS